MAFSLRVSASFRFPLYGMHAVSATGPIGHESFFQASISNRMMPEFVRLFLQSPEGQKELLSKQSGSVQQVINLSELRSIRIPVLPADEQRTCVNRLLAVQADTERLASPYRHKLAALDELKASLLHQAFTGQL